MRWREWIGITLAVLGCEAAAAAPVTVYYLHGTIRCITCVVMEDVTNRTVRDAFGDLLAEGVLALETVDYDQPENAHYLDDFDLEMPGVVLAASAGDTLTAWRRLDRTWELSERHADLERYITDETRAFVREVLGEEYAP